MGVILDNCVARDILRQRWRRMQYEILPTWGILAALALLPAAGLLAAGSGGLGVSLGQALFIAALGGYWVWLVQLLAAAYNPLSQALREGTFGQVMLTGLAPGTWLIGSLEAFVFDALMVTLLLGPVFGCSWILGGVSGGSLLLCLAVTWVTMLNLFLAGALLWRRPVTAGLVLIALVAATVLSAVLLWQGAGNDEGASAWFVIAGSLSPLQVLAVETAGPWLDSALLGLLRQRLSLGVAAATAREAFFVGNGVLILVQALSAAAGSRAAPFSPAVGVLVHGRRPEGAPVPSVAQRVLILGGAIRLFQENRGRSWQVFADLVVMLTDAAVFSLCLGYFLIIALALQLRNEAPQGVPLVCGLILAVAALACGGTACFPGGALAQAPPPAGWWRSLAWSVCGASLKALAVTVAAYASVQALMGVSGDGAPRAAAASLAAVMLLYALLCIGLALLLSTLRANVGKALRDMILLGLAWLFLPLLVLPLVQHVLPMLPGLLVIPSLSPLLPALTARLVDGQLVHRYRDGSVLLTPLCFHWGVYAWSLALFSGGCVLTAGIRLLRLLRPKEEAA